MEGPPLGRPFLFCAPSCANLRPLLQRGNSMRNLVVIAMIATAASLAGCGKSDTKVYSTGKGSVAVSQSGDHMTVTGSNGEKVEFGSGASATAKLPSYLPLYPGAKVTTSFT